jgi:hypothetical protein
VGPTIHDKLLSITPFTTTTINLSKLHTIRDKFLYNCKEFSQICPMASCFPQTKKDPVAGSKIC